MVGIRSTTGVFADRPEAPMTIDEARRDNEFTAFRDDVAARLERPAPIAAQKFNALRRAAEQADGSLAILRRESEQCRARRDAIDSEIAELDRNQSKHAAALRAAAQERREAAQRELRAVLAELEERSEPVIAQRGLVARLKDFAVDHPGEISDAEAADLGEIAAAEIAGRLAATRADIAGLKIELTKNRSAPLPAAEANRIAAEQVERLAARASFNVGALIDKGAALDFPKLSPHLASHLFGNARVGVVDVEALLARLFRPQILRAIQEDIDELAEDEIALLPGEKRQRLAFLEAKLLEGERLEEALIVAAEKVGLNMARRADADPRAVLGVRLGGAQ
jgi:hypothetical protein